jgi:hypothetical protein
MDPGTVFPTWGNKKMISRTPWGAFLISAATLACCAAFAQTPVTVNGSFAASPPDGGFFRGIFNCTGIPTCTGTYAAQDKDLHCSNAENLSGSIQFTGLALDHPGAIQGTITVGGANYQDTQNADGTCTIKPGTAQDVIVTYTGTWNGSSGIASVSLLQDLNPFTLTFTFTANVPSANPVFPMTVTSNITPTTATVNAQVQFRPQDVGTNASLYVFALAPAAIVKDARAPLADPSMKGAKDLPVQCVLAQLSASGQLQSVSASNMQAYLSGVLSSQGASVGVLNGASTPNIAGATFFVGYGSTSQAMISGGVNRSAATIPAAQTCFPAPPQTGWWWNPNEPGRGFSMEMQGNNLFFASYLYDTTGRATWLAALGPTSLDGSFFSGNLISFKNGQTLTGGYHAADSGPGAGAVTLAFSDATHGTLIWPGGTMPIERFNIVANGLTLPPVANQPENGWWWNPAEGGRGFFLEWQGASAFVAGYMYDASGNPIWYVAFPTTPNILAMQSAWQQFGNGQSLTGAYKAPAVVNGNVGAMGVTFSGAANATLSLPDGRQVPLTRFHF